jgi:hypothetical protein
MKCSSFKSLLCNVFKLGSLFLHNSLRLLKVQVASQMESHRKLWINNKCLLKLKLKLKLKSKRNLKRRREKLQ